MTSRYAKGSNDSTATGISWPVRSALTIGMAAVIIAPIHSAIAAAQENPTAEVRAPQSPTQLAQAEPLLTVDIPAQPLNDAILSFAKTTGLQVFFDAAELQGLRTQGVRGRYEAKQALDILLAGTGLRFRLSSDDTITLEKASALRGPVELAPITVAGNREGSALDTLSRNVTVIDREEITALAATSQSVGDILAKAVPGMAPSSQTLTNTSQTLRGRQILVLIDGVPMNTNRNVSRDLFNISPSNIQSIEVVHGGSSVYGGGAAGGVIHITTLTPQDGSPVFETTLSGASSLTHFSGDALSGLVEQKASGKSGGFEYLVSVSAEAQQAFYDADGDRIAPEPSQGDLSDSNTLGFLGKIGYRFADQRIHGTVSYLNAEQNTDYVSDPAVNAFPAGSVKSRALSGLQLSEQTANENLILNLGYSKDDVFGSSLETQAYYRAYHSRFAPFDGRPFGGWNSLAQTYLNSDVLGGRLTVDTPLTTIENLDAKVLWGADVNHEETEQPADTFDGTTFDNSGGTIFAKTADGRTFVPLTTTESYGVFGQLELYPTDMLVLRGGVRRDWVEVSFPGYTTLGQGNQIQAGTIDYAETTFNLGAVLSPLDTLDLYANFSQSFELPDIGLQLRFAPAGFNAGNSNLAPQVTDNFEVGLRHNWRGFEGGLAGFYSKSDLGSVAIQNFSLVQNRTPERIYGVEADGAYRVAPDLRVGGTFTWIKGEQKAANTGKYIALNSLRIPPAKLTGFVEYSPRSWWDLRLQVLHSMDRDDASDDGVGFGGRKVEDYTVVDLYSAFDTGPGTLKVGLENLLNNQYHTVYGQLLRNGQNTSHLAARGLTARVAYTIQW